MSTCDSGSNTAPSQACPSDWPVIVLQQNMVQNTVVRLVDNNGNPQTVPIDPGDSSSGSPSTVGTTITFNDASSVSAAKLYMKETPESSIIVAVTGTYDGDGVFTFSFTEENTSQAGIFIADIFLFDEDGKIIFVKHIFIDIEWNTTDMAPGSSRQPISISEIRLAIRDNCPENNYLLDDYEFSDREIWYCIRRPVDMWNETPPPVGRYSYSNFPYRYHWTQAVIGHLLRMAAHRYRRNRLSYNAAGVSVDDQNKAQEYEQAAQTYLQEYMQWMRSKKMEINIENGYGGFSGGWAR